MSHVNDYPSFDAAMDDCDVWAEAALLFLDEADFFDDAMTDLGSASPTTPPPVKTEQQQDEDMTTAAADLSQQPSKPRRVNRRREEILFLRQQAKQLESRLLAARQRMEETAQLDRELQPMERELLNAAWSTIAAQQRDQREQSEAEHDRLLQLLDEQRQLAKSLQRFARRHAVHEIPAPLAMYAQLHTPQPSDTQVIMTPTCFDELERALESMYEQRDAVFSSPQFDSVLATLRTGRIVNANTSRAGVEMLDACVTPFDVQATANAVWHSMMHYATTSVTISEKFEAHPDIAKKSFVAVLDLPMFQSSLRAHVVVRRVVEPHRVVILRATHFEPISLTNSGIDPFTLRHYQWNSIESPQHERLRTTRFATSQVQSFNLSFPSLCSDSEPQAHEKILQFCETALSYRLDMARQSLENLLVGGLSSTAMSTDAAASRQQAPAIKLEAC